MIQKTSLMAQRILQYRILLLSGHKGKKIHPTTIKVTIAQLDGGSKSHVFIGIKIFAYIRPVQCNDKFSMVAKPLQKFLACHHLKYIYVYNYTTLSIILYATEPKKHNHSKLYSNIIMNSENLELKISDGYK